MAVKLRDIVVFLRRGLYTALVVSFIVVLFNGPIKTYVLPPLKAFLDKYVESLLYLAWFVFIICSLLMLFIIWWTRWADKRLKSKVTHYVSRLIAKDYYKGSRKADFYRAIQASMSRYPPGAMEGEEKADRDGLIGVTHVYEVAGDPDEGEVEVNVEDGYYRTYHSNENLRKEYSIQDGKLDGYYRVYYEDGSIRQEKFYKSGKLSGLFKAYDEYGILYFEISYKDGRKHGIENLYNKNGIIQYKIQYNEGEMVNRKTYNDTGELKFDHHFGGDVGE